MLLKIFIILVLIIINLMEQNIKKLNFKSKDTFFSKDSCNVKYNNNVFIGNLDSYVIKIDPKDFDGFGLDIKLNSKDRSL